MNARDKKRIINLYEQRYHSYGYDIKTVGWKDWKQQALRFKILTDPFDLSGKSVCDVGCGFGDFFRFLKERFKGIRYTGIDVSPSLIAEARKRYPAGEFLLADILKKDLSSRKRFDYCFLSGAFNFRISDNIGFAKKMIKKMFSITEEAVAFNMLSTYVDYRKRMNFHYRPEDVFRYAKSLSRFVGLRHDYPLWEFTVYISRYGKDQA